MLNLRVTIDLKDTIASLTALEQRQLPFAASKAINDLGLAFQKAERERIARVFTLRRPDFILREGVKRLGPAATKTNPSVTFGVSDRADFLRRFETGEPKRPTQSQHLAVPQQVRRNQRDIITKGNRPRALIQRLGAKKGAGQVFVLREKKGRLGPGVFQKTGKQGKGQLKFLYGLEPVVKTPEILGFVDTARQVTTQWPRLFDESLAFAVRTAK